MKSLLLFIMLSTNLYAYDCEHFQDDKGKMEALTYITTKTIGYKSVSEFCQSKDYLDLELSFMPNYFKFEEEDDDHYKMMIHKSYSSCTYIYNSTKKFVTDKSCYSTW